MHFKPFSHPAGILLLSLSTSAHKMSGRFALRCTREQIAPTPNKATLASQTSAARLQISKSEFVSLLLYFCSARSEIHLNGSTLLTLVGPCIRANASYKALPQHIRSKVMLFFVDVSKTENRQQNLLFKNQDCRRDDASTRCLPLK